MPSPIRSVRAAYAERSTTGSRLFDSPFHTQPKPRSSARTVASTQIAAGTCAAELNSVSMITARLRVLYGRIVFLETPRY